jgi:hypothetical protein
LKASASDKLSVSAEITSRANLTNENIRVYFAVIEKVITGTTLPNGESDIRNVFREFLPSPLGQIVEDKTIGGVSNFEEEWIIDQRKVLDPNNLAVVVFVQNVGSTTKEVYQAARVDVSGKVAVLGVGDVLEVDDLNIYPNPANDYVNVTFDQTLEDSFQWILFDQSGKLIQQGEVKQGQDGFRIETSNIASGLYMISIGNKDKQYLNNKILIKH